MNAPEVEERQMLADSVRKWAERGITDADRAASSAHPHGCMPERWREFAEMGWLGVAVPEADGGLGGGLPEVCVLAEELGRALVVEPFVAAVVLGGMLLADVASGSVRQAWLPALADGSRRVAFAPWEPQSGHDAGWVDMTAVRRGEGWKLDGDKALAPGVPGADGFIVAARTGSGTLGLFLLKTGAASLRVREHRLYDGRHAGTLHLGGVDGDDLLMEGPEAEVLAAIERALDRALVAHCAETVGTMSAAFDVTRGYLTTRKQFGRPIAANQVIQHRLVDLYVEIEEARALWRAAAAAPGPRLVAALAARTAEVARHTWEEAIQLHGAIGMTEEYVLGTHVRRLALAASLYGDAHLHLERLAALSLGARQ